MTLEVIAFDLWETLITNTPEISRVQKRRRLTRIETVLIARGHAAEAEQIERAYRTSWKRCHELYWSEDRDIPCRRQIEVFLEDLGLEAAAFDEATLDELEREYANAAVEVLPAVVSGALEVLAAVRERGLRTGLISNTGRTPGYALRKILTRLELAPMLDVMVFSDEHGSCKPRKSIFEELRAALGARWDEMLFVGDNLYVDVLGARRCGMRAVHFVPAARGTAVAPHIEADVIPDATITALAQLPALIDSFQRND